LLAKYAGAFLPLVEEKHEELVSFGEGGAEAHVWEEARPTLVGLRSHPSINTDGLDNQMVGRSIGGGMIYGRAERQEWLRGKNGNRNFGLKRIGRAGMVSFQKQDVRIGGNIISIFHRVFERRRSELFTGILTRRWGGENTTHSETSGRVQVGEHDPYKIVRRQPCNQKGEKGVVQKNMAPALHSH